MANELLPGTSLMERYSIIETIAKRDYCNIYKAEDRVEKKIVAVKELFIEAIEKQYRDEALAKFVEEIVLYKELEHENVAPIYNCFRSESAVLSENKQFIVTEYIQGKTLREIKKEKKDSLKPEELKPWILQICSALKYLHEQNPPILFYYLSPDHIIITEDNKVKLINFGMGRFFRSGPFKSNRYMGMPGYSASEQYGIKKVDSRADIFGLGAVIYYMLTEDDPEKHHLNFSPVRTLNPIVSMQFARLISKCLQMKPEDRFENIDHLIKRIEAISLEESQVSSELVKKKEKTEQEEKEVKEKPKKAPGTEVNGWHQNILWTTEKHIPVRKIAPVAIIILVTGLILFFIGKSIMSGPSSPGSLIFATQLKSDEIAVIDGDKKTLFKTLKTGECKGNILVNKDKIYVNGSVSNIFILDTKKVKIDSSINIGTSILDMVMTGDGSSIYGSSTAKGEVLKIAVATKSVATSISVGEAPTGLALSSNEHYLYVANFNSDSISVIDTATNTSIETIENTGTKPKKLLIVPDSNLLYCANWGSGDVTVINTANNSIVKKIKTGDAPNDILLSPDRKRIYVSNNKSRSISIIDMEKDDSVTEINLSGNPLYMGLSPDKKSLLISLTDKNKNNNKILVIDINTNEIIEEIPVNKCILSFIKVNV